MQREGKPRMCPPVRLRGAVLMDTTTPKYDEYVKPWRCVLLRGADGEEECTHTGTRSNPWGTTSLVFAYAGVMRTQTFFTCCHIPYTYEKSDQCNIGSKQQWLCVPSLNDCTEGCSVSGIPIPALESGSETHIHFTEQVKRHLDICIQTEPDVTEKSIFRHLVYLQILLQLYQPLPLNLFDWDRLMLYSMYCAFIMFGDMCSRAELHIGLQMASPTGKYTHTQCARGIKLNDVHPYPCTACVSLGELSSSSVLPGVRLHLFLCSELLFVPVVNRFHMMKLSDFITAAAAFKEKPWSSRDFQFLTSTVSPV
ncbi:hypothetical protein F2P81_001149 [Scophthalmus maximus]|uniref:Uncharacterized protein n=1 Tax=Scophthalmus maximus TaxID=52904 RepID=A0A6A4TJ10_SCOMX|nr:hypothetical protein F2P81_001149 [Scophthalmus maximus]